MTARVYRCPLIFLLIYCCFPSPYNSTLQPERRKMMQAAQFKPGGPENLVIGQVPIPDLQEKEILIQVFATAINRADTLQRKGLYPPPAGESDILGLEAAGIVHKLGSGSSKWQIGDRVMALLPGGGNAEYARVREDHVMPVGDHVPFTEAAAIPEVWLTAYQILHFVGGVKAGDRVLIHAGGSGVGTAAVQLVTLIGATAMVTAGAQSKIDFAKSLGAVEGFNYKEGSFGDKVLQYTNGEGVDLILDCVGSSFWEQNAKALKTDGTWVLYGLLGGGNIEGNFLGQMLRKRIQLKSSTLRTRTPEYKAKLIADFTEHNRQHFVDGKLKVIIDSVLPLSELADAHQNMEENKNTGKIVIEVRKEGGAHSEL